MAMNLAFWVLRGVWATCGEKGRKEAKGRSLQVAEWSALLQIWGNRKEEAAISCSSQDHFVRKDHSWCYTKKHTNKANLIQEGLFVFQ